MVTMSARVDLKRFAENGAKISQELPQQLDELKTHISVAVTAITVMAVCVSLCALVIIGRELAK